LLTQNLFHSILYVFSERGFFMFKKIQLIISIFVLLGLTHLVFVQQNKNQEPKVIVQPATPIVEIVEEEPTVDYKELQCLTVNIYHESRSELTIGQYAVADVVLNRVESKRYPNTVCGVVYQARLSPWGLERGKTIPLKHKCQFSWYCDGKTDVIRDNDAYERAKQVAYNIMYNGKYRHITEHATHYHTNYVNPSWNSSMQLIGTIGNHIFYIEE